LLFSVDRKLINRRRAGSAFGLRSRILCGGISTDGTAFVFPLIFTYPPGSKSEWKKLAQTTRKRSGRGEKRVESVFFSSSSSVLRSLYLYPNAVCFDLEIDSSDHSQFKSPSGWVQFHYKIAGAADPVKPARTSDKLDGSHVIARGGV
jgi:hypothetical protein